MVIESAVARLADAMKRSARVTALTGAGVSAASGVPTFRGAGGLWRTYRAEDLATPQAFARDPGLVWAWYDWRRGLIAACRPNRAHDVLAAWSGRDPGFTLITQNVDGLHERAGAEQAIRLHGSIWEVSCWEGCRRAPARWRHDTVPLEEIPLRCPHCGGLARPAVVWFGESLDPSTVRRSLAALDCDLFLTIGTSSIVYPAASLVHDAKSRGAFTAEINLDSTPASAIVDLAVQGPAEEILDRVEKLLRRT